MTPVASPAFAPSATLKPLGFDPARLNGLSERLIRSHWENNYGGSVKALAVVKRRLAEALDDKDTPPYVYNDLKREHLLRTGSVVLHELYFVDAFFQNICWETVLARREQSSKLVGA